MCVCVNLRGKSSISPDFISSSLLNDQNLLLPPLRIQGEGEKDILTGMAKGDQDVTRYKIENQNAQMECEVPN